MVEYIRRPIMSIPDRLRDLGRNLYWTWHPEVLDIFRDIDSPLWRDVNHNPVEFLSRLPDEAVRDRTTELTIGARIAYAFNGLRDYLQSGNTWTARHAGSLSANSVAYFSAEFGLHESLPTYAGGLGVLAGDHLKAASDLGVPLVGVGLFYAKGYFNQILDSSGWQKERYFDLDVNLLPLEQAKDSNGQPIRLSVACGSRELHVGLWTAHVGRCRLILLDTNVHGNNDEDRALTSMLYGGDVRTRIRQEVVLGIGGMRALAALGIRPGVIHMNEGHSAFAVLEMARVMMEREGRTFEGVRERVAGKTVFTTHTPVEAGHDRFEPTLVKDTLTRLRQQIGLSETELLALGRKDPTDKNEMFCMTILGLKMSRFRNAVSALHGRVTRAMWHGLWPDRDESEVPIGHITNGIHVATWLAVTMAHLYSRYLGNDWQDRMSDPQTWTAVDQINPVEFWEQHQMLKAHMINYVRRSVRQQADARGDPDPIQSCQRQFLDPTSLTIGFARRFAGYKRADLLLRDPDRLDRLVNHPEHPVQFLYAGKAHPRDEMGKGLAQEVFKVTKDPRFAGRIVFLENHDINVSRHLVQGVDVWLNTPYRPCEACGTSGQKVLLNGGLNLSVLDGWWAEAYDGSNGFAIGGGDENSDWQRQDKIDRADLFDVLEQQVVPLFYRVDEEGVPRGWVDRQKNAIRTLAWRFSAHRMVADYVLHSYLPAAGSLSCSCPTAGGHCE
jgi:glycogen phosphorylase